MKLSHLTTSILAFGLLAGCAQAEQASQKVTTSAAEATDTIKSASNVVKTAAKSTAKTTQSGVSIHTAVPGVYKSEASHAYITFQYLHQGYAVQHCGGMILTRLLILTLQIQQLQL